MCSHLAVPFSVGATICRNSRQNITETVALQRISACIFFIYTRNDKLTEFLLKSIVIKRKSDFLERIIVPSVEECNVVKSLSFIIEQLNQIYLCATSEVCIFISHLY